MTNVEKLGVLLLTYGTILLSGNPDTIWFRLVIVAGLICVIFGGKK